MVQVDAYQCFDFNTKVIIQLLTIKNTSTSRKTLVFDIAYHYVISIHLKSITFCFF